MVEAFREDLGGREILCRQEAFGMCAGGEGRHGKRYEMWKKYDRAGDGHYVVWEDEGLFS